jgi:hypothetical protein
VKKQKTKTIYAIFLIVFKGKLVIPLCFKNEIENSTRNQSDNDQ